MNDPVNPIRVAKVCAVDLSVHALLKPQIDAIDDAGYEVEAVCSDGPFVPQLRREGMAVRTVEISRAISPWQDLRALVKLWRLFRRQRYAIVHTHTPKAAFLGQLAAKLAGVPVRINTIHGLYYLAVPDGVKRWLFKTLEIVACRLSHHVFSQSAEDIELIQREQLVPGGKLEWLGNGIDLERFSRERFDAGEGGRVRAELGIPRDAFVVGILARMVTEKGFRELFEAFARLRQGAPNAYLLHIGIIDRSRNDEVTPDLAREHGIENHCRFVGQREDVPRLMMAMDIFCLPSYREGYPRSVMEANAMGVPAVVTDIRGCREAVIDGENGLLVPPREAEPLLRAMARLHEDPALRERMGRAARKRAETTFDERRVIQTVLARYESLLQRRGIASPGAGSPASMTH